MRRPVLRILLNAATVLSLVLCVATVVFWARSYHRLDSLTIMRARAYSISSMSGEVWLEVDTQASGPMGPFDEAEVRHDPYSAEWEFRPNASFYLNGFDARLFGQKRLIRGNSEAWFGTDVWYWTPSHHISHRLRLVAKSLGLSYAPTFRATLMAPP
jgi:hypothetical protein